MDKCKGETSVALSWQALKQRIGERLHAIVDRALKNSSVALYDQSLRDMAATIDHVEEAAVGMKAAAEGNKRHLTRYRSEAEVLQARLDQLLAQGEAEQAQRVQQALSLRQQQIAETQAQIGRQEEQHTALVHNWETLKERLRLLQAERGSVEALVAKANAERAIRDIEYTLAGLTGLRDGSELGVMADAIWRRLDEAEARLALMDVDAEVVRAAEVLEEARVTEQIQQRRRRLGLIAEVEKGPEKEPPTPETDPENGPPRSGPDAPASDEPSPDAGEPPVSET
jgi:phage shock protein A